MSAATDSDNPVLLEQATARAFQFLGFEARHIGGGGKTDVLATTNDKDLHPVRIIVDAKSARSGHVSEGSVSFDTLKEHRVQHKADQVVLVGPSFDSGRVKKRADANGVALLTTTELAAVLARHARTPLSAHYYLGLVSGGDEERTELEARWSASERRLNLISQIIAVLAEEARDTDEVTSGALTTDQIYLIVREGDVGPRPKPSEIESALEFLQHPLVDSVRQVQGDRGRTRAYQLVDDPGLVQAKFMALVRALDRITEPPEAVE